VLNLYKSTINYPKHRYKNMTDKTKNILIYAIIIILSLLYWFGVFSIIKKEFWPEKPIEETRTIKAEKTTNTLMSNYARVYGTSNKKIMTIIIK